MMPVPVGPEPPPQYVLLPPGAASRIRRTCTATGTVLLVGGAVLGLLLVILAYRYFSFPLNLLVPLTIGLATLFELLLGFAVIGARRYVAGPAHLDIAGAAPVRRVIVVLAVAVCLLGGFAGLLVAGRSAGYLVLVLALPALATVGTVVTLRTLRPPR